MKLYLKTNLNKEQKEAIGLLSVGTFLEYFDLMLYVHMAVVLNELFFPKTDPFTASLITAFSFCSIFVFRPFGALIFGYIGDNVGRKVTVVITTFLMSISCVIMATLPTYAQIGITASWIITICRIVQGMSSMGEIVGAEIYLTETVKPPLQYPVVMIIAIASILGGVFALALASLFSSYGFNWRYAFWIGAVIALVGAIARTTLREAVDFADAKRRLQITLNNELTKETLANNYLYNKKNNKITLLFLFFIQCGWPICFYFTYIYCGNFLKQNLGFTSDQVIHQNFVISIIALIGYIIITFLSYRVHPLKILQFKLWVFCPFAFVTPYLLSNIDNYLQLFFIQTFFVLFVLSTNPATPVFYNHISIFKRFTSGSFIYALSRAIMHIITSFGLVYLEKYFGYWGIVVIFVPMCMGFAFGLFHFKKLEIEAGNYYH
ncbi:MAG: MFS transporter [Proteobacteria bacterium]|nr:MFS transporter [Pseudomonadota bacterium]